MCDATGNLCLFQMVVLALVYFSPVHYVHDLHSKILVYAGFIFIENLVAFLVFRMDKQRAVDGEWRVPEVTLHVLCTMFGAVGAYVSMFHHNHKTSKENFMYISLLMAFMCAGLYSVLYFHVFRWH